MRLYVLLAFLVFSGKAFSQLGFCPGSKGDPIFHEDFGSGTGTGSPLPAGVTTYPFVVGDPEDGFYTISSRIGQDNSTWHSRFPPTTISNGKALIVNANFNTAGMFYEFSVSGLCEATTYEFSAFLMNVYNAASVDVCPGTGIPINVRFEIWDETDAVRLASGSTGNINGTSNPKWEQYALVFRSQPGQNKIILKMFNNGIGGCGNDLAIDDIIFRSCGDLTEIKSAQIDEDKLVVCPQDVPATVNLTATPNGEVYNSHAFQWQKSDDGTNWENIPGETLEQFNSAPIFSTTSFRVKVAEDEVNLNDNLCSSASNAFTVEIVEDAMPPLSLGDVVSCEGEGFPPLRVEVEENESVFWYSSNTGDDLLDTGTSFTPQTAGTYYAEARKKNAECDPSARTAVTLTVHSIPVVHDEKITICEGASVQLDAGAGAYTYQWDTGETSQEIIVRQPGYYAVVFTNSNNCSAEKHFEILPADEPGISEISSNGNSVIIEPANDGSFEYSLDGVNFQESNVFEAINGGIYTAFQRDLAGCKTVSKEFPHIVLPKFITPNNDGFNDRFELKGVEYFENSEIRIFNRYGKLLAAGKGDGFSWDGKYNGQELPAEDYWYQISIAEFEPVKGHFTLKR